jgi:hypothetical protein
MRTRSRSAATEPAPGYANVPSAGNQGPTVPFCQGSKPETEIAYSWSKIELAAVNAQVLGPIALPANGYIRNVWIEVETSKAGIEEGATAAEDMPFSLFEQIKLTEPNGAPLGMEMKGFSAYLANTYGGYAGSPDLENQIEFNATKRGLLSPRFAIRVPVELSPNGLGALGNQSASAALRLTLTVAAAGAAYYSAGKYKAAEHPEVTIRVIMELWGEPPERDILGRAVQQSPPFEGTAQYWSEQPSVTINAGLNQTRITRVGSMIRTLIFVYRKGGVREKSEEVAATGASNMQVQWDNRVFRTQTPFYNWQSESQERVERLKERKKGVYVWSFSMGEGRHVGEPGINSWLATLTSTRLEVINTAEAAGTVDILVNDVSVTAINPLERTQQIGVGGYHPPVGQVSNVAA